MAKPETDIVNRIMLEMSKRGIVTWRNVRGMFLTLDGSRKIKAGLLAEGASDLIGYKSVKITQDMVGQIIACAVALEIKTPTGRASAEQIAFTDRLRERGGKAGIARSVEDAIKIVE